MLNSMHLLSRLAINGFVFLIALTIACFAFSNTLYIVLGIITSILLYFVSNKVVYALQRRKQAKRNGISLSEYQLIEQALKTAREQAATLTQEYIRVRSVQSFRSLNDMSKLARRIINIVQTNPTRFYEVEDFFYAHLPSSVQLANNYATLTREKIQGTEIHLALEDTRKTLKALHDTMEQDLKLALQSDIENLKIELDFAKLSNEKSQERL